MPTDSDLLLPAVVRQEQIRAFAVVLPDGRELSLLLAPALAATEPHLRPGDPVAVRADLIAGHWPRGVALRPGPDGWSVRLGDGRVVTAPADPALLGPEPLHTGDPVWVAPGGILARAWPWYEPLPVPPGLPARLADLLPADH
jgi:hypothetical protein